MPVTPTYPGVYIEEVPSGVRTITAGPDGRLWFTEQDANNVAKVTTTGAFTEYPVPTANSGPWRITAGPDDNLWFTEFDGNKVAKIGSGFDPSTTTVAPTTTAPSATIPSAVAASPVTAQPRYTG